MNEATKGVPRAQKEIKLTPADKARFWSKVDKSAGPDGCWLWTACKFHDGYGCFIIRKKLHRAHRLSFIIENGAIPQGDGHHGTCVCHRCDVRECVNPSHLFLGSHQENVTDKMNKGRGGQKRGEGNGRAKLTEVEVLQMRKDFQNGVFTYSDLAAKFKMDASSIKDAVTGKTWRHLASVEDCNVA